MALQLGDTAPDFVAQTTDGTIRFHEWIGDSWAVLFSHPKDFTPICTTELGSVAKLSDEFERRDVTRATDLMIAATAASNSLPLYTANPDDFEGAEGLVEVVTVRARPDDLRPGPAAAVKMPDPLTGSSRLGGRQARR